MATVTNTMSNDTGELAAQLGDCVLRVARRLRRSSTRHLEPYGLTDGEARVLRLIARAGSPPCMSDIAKRIEVVPRSATTVVAGLEAKGFAVRRIDLDDRRAIVVRLTPAGEKLWAELGRVRNEAAMALFGRLAARDRTELLRLLVALDDADDESPRS